MPEAIVIGCSAGGVRALGTVLSGLAPKLPVPVIAVCHTGAGDIESLLAALRVFSVLPVVEAVERQHPAAGVVHLAPAGYHLLVERDASFALSVDERVHFCRPAIDVLFESAAACFQHTLIAVLLTGANADGAAGVQAVRQRRGRAIVQEPREAEVPTMPQAAIDLAGADHILPLREIAPLLNRCCSP